MSPVQAQLVERALGVIDHFLETDGLRTAGLAAKVPQLGRRDHVVVGCQRRDDVAPDTIRAEDAMEEHEWLAITLAQHNMSLPWTGPFDAT